MKFLDEAIIEVIAGNGGNGCASFRREKYVPKGGPDGGDGGCGGNVVFKADGGLTTLMDVKYHHRFKAGHGAHGKGKQMTGAGGKNVVVRVPTGTVVFDFETDDQLADLDETGATWVAAKGGRGGLGNMHFVSSVNQAPHKATEGKPGEHKKLKLELKLLADVGLVGLPNAGKSTLISSVSNARPKIACYPFTTKAPCLGLVKVAQGAGFVMADIPGLIEGAHKGVGMGMKFLKHIERTKLILHLVDLADPTHKDAVGAYKKIRKELKLYNPEFVKRPEIVVITKTDLSEVRENLDTAKKSLTKASKKKVLTISAVTHEGLKELIREIVKGLGR